MILKFIKKFIEIIFPNKCLSCNKIISSDALFCNEDWNKLKFITNPKCKICSNPFIFHEESERNLLCAKCLESKPCYDKSIIIFYYNDLLRKVISSIKYYDNSDVIKKFAKMIAKNINDNQQYEFDLIISVPLHKKRLKKRKFNQSILLAKNIKKNLSQKLTIFYPDFLLRKENTISQTRLNKKEREKNLKNIFELNKKYKNLVIGKRILLIDDVITTGSTLNNCAKVLKNSGAAEITIATIAKTILM